MKKTLKLVTGDIKRLVNYKILPISIATTLLWVVIIFFVKKDEALFIAPFLIFVDVSLMSLVFLGASFHFERQENTVKAMMVMPVSLVEIMMSKITSSIFLGLTSAFLTSIALFFIHGITYNYLLLFVFVIIAGAAHGAIGLLMAISTRDFTTMLGLMMLYTIVFSLPSILVDFEVISVKYEKILFISPAHSSSELINTVMTGNMDTANVLLASFYLIIGTFCIIKFLVYPRYKEYAVRG